MFPRLSQGNTGTTPLLIFLVTPGLAVRQTILIFLFYDLLGGPLSFLLTIVTTATILKLQIRCSLCVHLLKRVKPRVLLISGCLLKSASELAD